MAVEVQSAGLEEQPLEETVGPTEGWEACSAAACSVVGLLVYGRFFLRKLRNISFL